MRVHDRKIVFVLVILIVSAGIPLNIEAATIEKKINEDFKVSDGVHYNDTRLTEKSEDTDTVINNAVRVMEINTKDPYTKVEIGYPAYLNRLETTTSQALKYHQDNHKVVGAINGSFYQFQKPMYLVSKNNRLVRAGEVYDSEGSFVNEPIAFGVSESGEGMIDHYQLKLEYTYSSKAYQITSTNKQRSPDSTILYTSQFPSDYTETNEFGREIVVSLPTNPTFEFGSIYKGTVVDIRDPYDQTKTEIPDNGFVISGHGLGSDKLQDIELGESISVSVDIDEKWKNSSFMLASGPMLVKDGEVALSMDPNSWRARQEEPRTAVAIDKTGEKVFFVTVDGSQDGYSEGMNMSELAEYLVSLGADRALNLDGGGSTTMAARYPGNEKIKLANSPSDGRERGVSTILMATSTAPDNAYYTDVQEGDSHNDGIYWLTTKGIEGYEDGSFGVDRSLTRPHTAIMFSRALGLDIPSAEKVEEYYTDVNADDLYAKFIAAVGEAGIFKGSNGNFLPDKKLTREQMASTLVNAFGLKSDGEDVDVNLKNVSETHKGSVQILANLGITNQLDDFRPSETVTRGQFSTFLYLSQQSGN